MDRYEEKEFLEDNYRIYLNEVLSIPILTEEEERVLLNNLNNKEARDKLVEANLRFVISIARKY